MALIVTGFLAYIASDGNWYPYKETRSQYAARHGGGGGGGGGDAGSGIWLVLAVALLAVAATFGFNVAVGVFELLLCVGLIALLYEHKEIVILVGVCLVVVLLTKGC